MATITGTSGDLDLANASAQNEGVLLDDRFEIQPREALPELTQRHAQAFAAHDHKDPHQKVYALLIAGHLPAREQVLLSLKGAGKNSLAQPLGWGPVWWPPANGERLAIVLTRPPGRRLMPQGGTKIEPIPAKRLIEEFLRPVSALLRELGDMRVAHRNVRADNLYQEAPGARIVLGECVSAPAGFAQPAVYEPVERALALPAGRGTGTQAEDFYALGVTLATLALGSSALAGKSDEEVTVAKLEHGSYAAIVGSRRPPAELVEALRGLLCDDEGTRWGASELDLWLVGRRRNPQAQVHDTLAQRPFLFAEKEYHTARTLAVALAASWDTAASAVQGDALERWVRLALKDRQRADNIAGCRTSGRGGPRRISDDLLLARTLVALDPTGPLRYRRLRVMPDGLGPALAQAIDSADLAHDFVEMISGMLPGFRVQQSSEPTASQLSIQDMSQKMARFLAQRGPGYHLERCLYELNSTLPCRSQRLSAHYAISVPALLRAIDDVSASDDSPIDRHVAAFLAARLRISIDRNLNEIGGAERPAEAVLGQLRLLARAQAEVGPESVPKLCAAFLRQVAPVLAEYRNLPLRKRLREGAENATARGRLEDLLFVVDNEKNRGWDAACHRAARARYAAAGAEIERLARTDPRRSGQALKLGHRVAAYASGVISLLAMAFTVLTQLP